MKKLLKGIMGAVSLAAVAAGAYYFMKKWMDERDEELEDGFDDLDFDEEDAEDSREYVTLDLDKENDPAEEEPEKETAAQGGSVPEQEAAAQGGDDSEQEDTAQGEEDTEQETAAQDEQTLE